MKIIGLKLFKNKIIKSKKGDIIRFVSKKNSFYRKFGEVYFSEIKKNKIKGWNFHKRNICLISVPYGKVKFNFIDGRKKSSTYHSRKKVILSKKNYKIICVPPGVWFSFESLSSLSLVVNFINNPHDDKETMKTNKVKNITIPE